jgi:hypothetical protein
MDAKFEQGEIRATSLSIDDLDISEVDVYGLTGEDTLGVPELGASYGTYGCCSCCPCQQDLIGS